MEFVDNSGEVAVAECNIRPWPLNQMTSPLGLLPQFYLTDNCIARYCPDMKNDRCKD